MNTKIAKTLETVERERESCSLKATAVLAYLNERVSSFVNGLNIIYRRIKVDMQLIHMKSVY